ncbi:uncharacterized protein METZ01_LOCUS157475 [marine metagenome]|uniref:HTH cro/C1-type domain-containing protein n=1 Tax=marine metagenome TaxID=408172 RepID=A0A382ATJ6_9ZZZZ|tara:strand:- start:209 stop:436 length:228 start_codon:yes stop_codon:yes gene_type:complete
MRERQEIIRDFIVAELQKRGLSIKDVANRLGKSQGAVQQVVRSWTSTRIIRNELIKIIKVNPWTKFPPQEYKFED